MDFEDLKMKVMILTLHSGENEFPSCLESIKRQTHADITHKVFSGLGNWEAHNALYQTVMESSGDFDIFIKLDADMVFTRSTVVEEICGIFSSVNDLDHLVCSLEDWPSQRAIMGMHIFSNRVMWNTISDRLFVDPDPYVPGGKIVLSAKGVSFATHMASPSLEQAYLFGMHRALKVIQREQPQIKVSQVRSQFVLLERIYDVWRVQPDVLRAAMLLGAERAFSSTEAYMKGKSSSVISHYDVQRVSSDEICQDIEKLWGRRSLRRYIRKIRWHWLPVTTARLKSPSLWDRLNFTKN
ncbi:hypothetical protein [Limimaricola litoreus]|uniref:Glycosyl transferase family 2 n=1 Tax=Limimaricola litoreus TaxID=2955316 RepID=A0A9X2FPF9_9RHOB|nr:hypothetical protein [Limimaricola litoreus]MCP1169222.1 hypothetical protein [Limimaricola litoreus]